VIACALPARADAIVSGAAHLLNLKRYKSIDIMSASAALALIEKR
jgi:predicted nucleic acid-binding protein